MLHPHCPWPCSFFIIIFQNFQIWTHQAGAEPFMSQAEPSNDISHLSDVARKPGTGSSHIKPNQTELSQAMATLIGIWRGCHTLTRGRLQPAKTFKTSSPPYLSSFISTGQSVRHDYASLMKCASVQYLANITPTSFWGSVWVQVPMVFGLVLGSTS